MKISQVETSSKENRDKPVVFRRYKYSRSINIGVENSRVSANQASPATAKSASLKSIVDEALFM